MADAAKEPAAAAPKAKAEITMFDQVLWTLPEGVQQFVSANTYAIGIAWSCFGIIGFLVVYGLLQVRTHTRTAAATIVRARRHRAGRRRRLCAAGPGTGMRVCVSAVLGMGRDDGESAWTKGRMGGEILTGAPQSSRIRRSAS